MLTYQVRPRVLRTSDGQQIVLPADIVVRFHFLPQQPFGEEAGGGRTAVRAQPAKAVFNANTGAHTIESKAPLDPLDVTLTAPNQVVRLRGRVLEVVTESR